MKNLKKESLTIRLEQKEKKKLERNAAKNNMLMSEYVRSILFATKPVPVKEKKHSEICVTAQQILNVVSEKYGECEELEGMVKDIWKLMQN